MRVTSLLSIAGMFVAGSVYQAMRKVLFQMRGPGLMLQVHHFRKPWFVSLQGAVGCLLCFIPFWFEVLKQRRREREKRTDAEVTQPLLDPAAELDTVLDEVEHIMNSSDGHVRTEAVPAISDDAKAVVPVPYHPTMKHDEYVKGSYHRWDWKKVARLAKLAAPAVAGQLAVGLQGAGLVYTSASANQMISGSVVIFAAVLSKLFLARQLNKLHYAGMGLVMAGVTFVALSGLAGVSHQDPGAAAPDVTPAQALAGILLTLLSQFVAAGQMILEELLLGDVHLHPYELLGWEGLFGTIFMICLSLPIVGIIPGDDAGGRLENTKDTLAMLHNSRRIAGIDSVVFGSALLVNVASLFVTSVLGSVFRAVLTVSRTAFVWAFDVALYYSAWSMDGELGEAWDNHTSPIQLVGFVLGLAGTLVYAQGTTRVARAQQELADRKIQDPHSEEAHQILRHIYFPGWKHRPRLTQVRSFKRLRECLAEVSGPRTWRSVLWSTLTARTSWVLKGTEVDPSRHGTTRFRDPFMVRLPFKELPNGAIEVRDEEDGDYCVPARAPGTPPPPHADA